MAKKRNFDSCVLRDCANRNAMAYCTNKTTWQVIDLLIENMTDRQIESFLADLRNSVQNGQIKVEG